MPPCWLPAHGLVHPNPAGAVLVLLPDAVPRELHLDAAQFVGPDVLAGGADHQRRLRAMRERLGERGRRAQRLGHRVRGEVDLHLPVLLSRGGGIADLAVLRNVFDQ
jgi:hypothetical protein